MLGVHKQTISDRERGKLRISNEALFAMRWLARNAVLVFALLVAGCEADADKLERLEADAETACIVADADERVAATTYPGETAADRERRRKEASDTRTKCTLARREISRFMGR